jgi:hypothetical protein
MLPLKSHVGEQGTLVNFQSSRKTAPPPLILSKGQVWSFCSHTSTAGEDGRFLQKKTLLELKT